MSEVVYAREQNLSVDDYIDVVGHSALGPTRPLNDRDRVAAMLAGADLIVSARLDGRCVGVARCLTDFAWVAYLGDLAVHDGYQGRGIGKGLLEKTHQEVGDKVGVALLSVPEAVPFYEKAGPPMGLRHYEHAYWMDRRHGA
jgi:GNAT superfamily N-acetyltransferase